LPLIFEPTTDPAAQFIARGSGYGLFLGPKGATLALHSSAGKSEQAEYLEMNLAGANSDVSLSPTHPLPGKTNYLLGNDSSRWRRNVPQFAQVQYENVYPGINLVFYGNQGQLEYDFQIAPGSDPSRAELEFHGAKQLELQNGALVLQAENGSVRLEEPHVYQEINGRRQMIPASFVLRGSNRAGFSIAAYDHSRELVIDPVLNFSTYFGGANDELNSSIALDGSGNIYLTGSTNSTNLPIPVPGVYQAALPGARNVYIAKITPFLGSNPTVLDYVTYLGGTGTDYPVGISVDGAGEPFVVGTTTSTDFPVSTTPYQSHPLTGSTGTQHVFVTRMNNTAAGLIYSSYLSGNGDDIATGMTIDAGEYVYITGTTTSNNAGDGAAGIQFPASTLPQALPFQSLPSTAPKQFFITKVNTQAPATGSITYSTYFGGGNFTTAAPVVTGGGIAVDTNGNIYFTGATNFIYSGCAGCGTTDFPIKNAYQSCLNVPASTAELACSSTNTTNSDAFVAKLNPNAPQGSGQLQWSTYLGGTVDDSALGVALDSGAVNVYVVGTTNSPDVTASATAFGGFQPCLDGPFVAAGSCPAGVTASDAFVARLSNPVTNTSNITNQSLTYFSYLGGTGDEAGLAITVDSASGAVVTGWTKSTTDFPVYPTSSNLQGGFGGGTQDAFLARLNTAAVSGQNQTGSWASYFGGSNADEGTGVTLDVAQNIFFTGDTTSNNLHLAGPLSVAQGGSYNGGSDAFVTEVQSAASLGLTGVLSLGNNQTFIAAGNQATFTYTLTNSGPDVAHNITVTDDISQQATIVPVTFNSASTTSGTCSGGSSSTNISCSIQSLQAGSTATIQIVLTPTPNSNGSSATFNGGSVLATGANNITPAQTTVPASMSDYGINVGPSSYSVSAAGQSAFYQVQLTPHPVYSTSISLACSGLPTGATCLFSPQAATLTGTSPSTSSLTISTTARPIVTPASLFFTWKFFALYVPLPGIVLLGISSGRRRRRVVGVFLLSLIALTLTLMPACSHTTTQPPVAGTPAGTYTITVTASSGSDTKSQAVQLVVP